MDIYISIIYMYLYGYIVIYNVIPYYIELQQI